MLSWWQKKHSRFEIWCLQSILTVIITNSKVESPYEQIIRPLCFLKFSIPNRVKRPVELLNLTFYYRKTNSRAVFSLFFDILSLICIWINFSCWVPTIPTSKVLECLSTGMFRQYYLFSCQRISTRILPTICHSCQSLLTLLCMFNCLSVCQQHCRFFLENEFLRP